jgi:hypothetical protein
MAAAPIALMAAGSVLGAVGAIRQGNAEYAAGEAAASNAENNASITRAQATEQERRARVIAAKHMGSIRVAAATSGGGLEGSALDVLQESAATAELDALSVRHQGLVKATAYQNEASYSRWRGRNARTSGYLSAASSLLAGGGQMAGYSGGPKAG